MTTPSTSTTLHIGRSTRRLQALLPLLLVLALLGAFISPATAAPGESRVLPQLQREAAEQPNRSFRVIVTRLDNNPSESGDHGWGDELQQRLVEHGLVEHGLVEHGNREERRVVTRPKGVRGVWVCRTSLMYQAKQR